MATSCCHAGVSEPTKAHVKNIIESSPAVSNPYAPSSSFAALTAITRSILSAPFQVEKGSLQLNSFKRLPPTFPPSKTASAGAESSPSDTSTVNYYLSPSFASLQAVFTSGNLQTESFLAVPTDKLDSFTIRYNQPGRVLSAGFSASSPRKGFSDKVFTLEADEKRAKVADLPADSQGRKLLNDLSFFSSNVKFFSDLAAHRGEISFTKRLDSKWTAGVQAIGSFCYPLASSSATPSCCAAVSPSTPIGVDAALHYADVNQQFAVFTEANHTKGTMQLVSDLSPAHSLAVSASTLFNSIGQFSVSVGNRIALNPATDFYGKFDLPTNTFSFAIKKQLKGNLSATFTGVADRKDPNIFKEWGFGLEVDY